MGLTPTYPANLPITARKDEIVAALRANRVVIIAGETGSGKTTQIPKMCLEAGLAKGGRIGCTQPRRVAALSVSRRIAEELNVQWGREVGCKIRFNDQTGRDTVIKMMTDGMLLAEAQADPQLREYSVIIIDEAHERSLNIDFLLGHLLTLLARREDIKVVITSATIDTQAFSNAFGNAPIIEVSGRLFPVEVVYLPIDHNREEAGEVSYVDAAVNAVDLALSDPVAGDILIFMPGERDIREARDLLEGRLGGEAEIIPLFGRLSAPEQERVFARGFRRKIIVATNIAETSLTIPGIRYVIDTGLARVSRYSPRTRTRRLPIEPISQSSANQRKGRAGRVSNGVCIRLYSEEEFNERPQFSQPEIQRANLAEVILRMMTFHLGEIESFPFINPPTPAAISAGYTLLQELGALTPKNQLTEIGRALGRLPVDPTIGRMILQAQHEKCVPEILVIAAGLSIQDPRERPLDQKDAAAQAHKQFADPTSDFLTLLKIWNTFHDKWDSLKTQNQLRRFCRDNFLNYMRMREWREVYSQLEESVEGDVPSLAPKPDYRAIHRSILTGLLGHVADKTDRNLYRASGNRQVMIFPGSSLFDRTPPKSKAPPPKKENSSQPLWIIAGEIVETTRLYARTVAGVEPDWIVELGAHVCKVDYREPAWDRKAGRVLVKERASLHGLELRHRRVGYAQVNATDATNIFILSALVEDEIDSPHAFLEHNRLLRQKIETWQTRMRHADLPDLDRAFFKFYAARIQNVSSTPDLNRFIKESPSGNSDFLKATEADIVGDRALQVNENSFPETVRIGDREIPLQYAYAPGEEHDGVTVQVPLNVAHRVPAGLLEWAVPGYREEQIQHLLRGLPKTLRVPLMPLEPKAREIAGELEVRDHGFLEALSRYIQKRYREIVPADAWDWHSLPAHLRPRIEVIGADKKVIAATKNFSEIQEKLEKHHANLTTTHWEKAAATFEKFDLRSWNFGDAPEELPIGGGLVAFPGLELADEHVNLRLFKTPREARVASTPAVHRLAELALQKELAWVIKDLRGLDKIKDLYIALGPGDELTSTSMASIRRRLFAEEVWPLRESTFQKLVESARARIPGLTTPFMDNVAAILRLRHELALHKKPYPNMPKDLATLLPKRFLDYIPFDLLPEIPRYLKAMKIRAERSALNPIKDQERQKQVQPYVDAWQKWAARKPSDPEELAALREFRWLVEEFKVSLFAQELGAKKSVSARKLDDLLAQQARG